MQQRRIISSSYDYCHHSCCFGFSAFWSLPHFHSLEFLLLPDLCTSNSACKWIPEHRVFPQGADISVLEREINYHKGVIYETPFTQARCSQNILKQFTASFLA